MSKEQIEEMTEILERICDAKECNYPFNCDLCQATYLYNAGYRKQEWISVDERLPENGTRCLVYNKRGNDGDYGIAIFADGFYYGEYSVVTHWMPFPELPKNQ